MQHSHIDLQQQSLKAQMKKAGASNSDFAIIVTSDTITEEHISIKNLATGEDKLFNMDNMDNIERLQPIASYIKNKE
jgi:histidyl-tRNA synthetase